MARWQIDWDGTITTRQKKHAPVVPERLRRVKAMIAAGEDIVMWSGTERYCNEVCKQHGLTGEFAPMYILGKPNYIVDNQGPFCKIMGRRRIITPEQFMEMTDGFE